MYTFISFCHADEYRAAGFFLVTDHTKIGIMEPLVLLHYRHITQSLWRYYMLDIRLELGEHMIASCSLPSFYFDSFLI